MGATSIPALSASPEMGHTLSFPNHIYVEPTNACNLSCRDCPGKEAERKISFLDFSIFQSLIRESSANGAGEFALHKDGEPLLHPDIIKMITFIKEIESENKIYLSTNGTKLDPTAARSILNAGVDWINISLGAITPSTYALVKGGSPNQFERVQKNAMILLEEREKIGSDCTIILQIIEQDGTEGEIGRFRRKWQSAGAQVGVWSFINWGGRIRSRHEPKLPIRYPCPSLWGHPAVNADGRVSACCVDWNCDLIIGDLKQNTLKEIWHGDKINALRRKHMKGNWDQIPRCAECNVWARDKKLVG